MNNEIKEINIPDNILTALGDLTNGALNYYKTPKAIELKHKLLLDYLQEENKRLKCIDDSNICLRSANDTLNERCHSYRILYEDYKSRCEKAVDEIQQLIDDVNNKTIIGLNNFLPKLEEIQNELADGVAEMSV